MGNVIPFSVMRGLFLLVPFDTDVINVPFLEFDVLLSSTVISLIVIILNKSVSN